MRRSSRSKPDFFEEFDLAHAHGPLSKSWQFTLFAARQGICCKDQVAGRGRRRADVLTAVSIASSWQPALSARCIPSRKAPVRASAKGGPTPGRKGAPVLPRHYKLASMNALSWLLLTAPIWVATGWPSLNSIRVGMLRT
jgi:hypothetical protein